MNHKAYYKLILLFLTITFGLIIQQTNANPIVTPTIDLISPKGDTYNTNQIELTFIAPKPSASFLNITFSSFSYSLDGKPLIPISGNTTINDLSIGTHSILVYGHTSQGTERSQTVQFDIYISSVLIIAVPIILVIALSAGIAIIYIKKHRSKQIK